MFNNTIIDLLSALTLGFLMVGFLVTLSQKIIPPLRWLRKLPRGSTRISEFQDREDWVIWASLHWGQFGRLITCPFCLSVHLSFGVAVYIQIAALPLFEPLWIVGATMGIPYLLSRTSQKTGSAGTSPKEKLDAPVHRDYLATPKTLSPKTTPVYSKPIHSPLSQEAMREFLKKRGFSGKFENGSWHTDIVNPNRARLMQMVQEQKIEQCWFPGCREVMQKLLDKKKSVEDGECPACELGTMTNDIFEELLVLMEKNDLPA